MFTLLTLSQHSDLINVILVTDTNLLFLPSETKMRAIDAFVDNRYLVDDGIPLLACHLRSIPSRVLDMEVDAQDGILISFAQRVR